MRLWESEGKILSFPDYIGVAQRTISQYRWQIPGETKQERASRVNLVAPTEWPLKPGCPVDKMEGILLIHGLNDSPYLMRDLGDYLDSVGAGCYLVRSILLPGHATVPGDLDVVDYHDWLDAGRYGVESFLGKVKSVSVVGFSTGGAVGLYWAFNPESTPLAVPLKSLILLSPSIQPKTFITKVPFLPYFLDKLSKSTGIIKWTEKHQDLDFAKYESFSLNGGYQIASLDGSLRSIPGNLAIPVFMALSREDNTIDARDSIEFFLSKTNSDSRMFLVATNNKDSYVRRAASDKRVMVRPGKIDSENILAFAHASFTSAPNNPHYGKDGDYANCLVYENGKNPENPKYCDCITSEMKAVGCHSPEKLSSPESKLVYGEVGDEKAIKEYVLRRLTFNPYFDEMAQQISIFLKSASEHN